MRVLFFGIYLTFISAFAFTSNAYAADYKFASIKGLIEQEVGALILPEIYKTLGKTIEINPHPGKRAQVFANSGKMDGEIMRIFTYGEETPNVIRVPTPYYSLETTAFVRKDSGIQSLNKNDLKNYKIAKVLGVKHTDNITKGIENVFDGQSTSKIMNMLSKKRFDMVLTNTVDGNKVLDELQITSIEPLTPPLAKLDLYHYIHKDHAELVPLIDQAIQKLQKSGMLDDIIARAEKSIIGQ